LGRILRPVAEVVLEKDGFSVNIPMYIDSGADISLIPFRFGRALGFKQGGGRYYSGGQRYIRSGDPLYP